MRNTVFFLAVFLVSSCALIVTPWIWPTQVAATHPPFVAPAPASPDQGLPAASPAAASSASAKVAVATISRSVHNVPRGLGYTSAEPSREEIVAFVASNRYRPHWVIER